MPAASRVLTRPSRGVRRKMTTWRSNRIGSAIKPQDELRRNSQEIKCEAAEIAQGTRDIAVAAIARRRGHGVGGKRRQAAAAKAADHVDILHQRQRAKAAELTVEGGGDEQPL